MILIVRKDTSPALGDIRSLSAGDAIALTADARERKDFGRIVDAIGSAVSKGAEVVWK